VSTSIDTGAAEVALAEVKAGETRSLHPRSVDETAVSAHHEAAHVVLAFRHGLRSGRSGLLGEDFATRRGRRLDFLNFALDRRDHVIVVFEILEEIADVEEGVAIESDFDEGRLHPRQYSCDPAFVDTSD